MIDVHSHLLPNIDDGSKSLTDSLELARSAVEDGITDALMTPHHMNGRYINHAKDVVDLTAQFQVALQEANIPLKVFPSQEVRINGNLLRAIENNDILSTDPEGRYILIEFPSDDVPSYTMDLLFKLQQMGKIPVIVHPERNTQFMKKPELLYQIISSGAYAQVTANSYMGTFGKAVMKFSEDIIDAGLAHVFASDAHHIPGRQYQMAAAFEKLGKKSDDQLPVLFEKNAKALMNGNKMVRFEESKIHKKKLFSAY